MTERSEVEIRQRFAARVWMAREAMDLESISRLYGPRSRELAEAGMLGRYWGNEYRIRELEQEEQSD
jgi:hypothetical protein